jgi:hypothetical protein
MAFGVARRLHLLRTCALWAHRRATRPGAASTSPSLARDLRSAGAPARDSAGRGLDRSPGPFAALRLPHREPPPLDYFAETFRDASGRSIVARTASRCLLTKFSPPLRPGEGRGEGETLSRKSNTIYILFSLVGKRKGRRFVRRPVTSGSGRYDFFLSFICCIIWVIAALNFSYSSLFVSKVPYM